MDVEGVNRDSEVIESAGTESPPSDVAPKPDITTEAEKEKDVDEDNDDDFEDMSDIEEEDDEDEDEEEEDDEMSADDETGESVPPSRTRVYLPGLEKLKPGEVLEHDPSAYVMLHKAEMNAPCLR